MHWWKRPVAILGGAVTVATVGTFAASFTGPGNAALRSVEGTLTSFISHSRPVVDAYAGGGGGSGSGLPPAQITINSNVELTSRITANVKIQINCGPLTQMYYPQSVLVQLSEAEGRTIATAYNETVPNVTCDGSYHSYKIMVQAQNEPLRAARGVVDVNVQFCGVDSYGNYDCQSGSKSKLVNITT